MKNLLFAKANWRRAKGQAIVTFILVMIAALALNLWLMLATDYRANFGRLHDKLHAEHVTLVATDPDGSLKSFLTSQLSSDTDISEFECSDALLAICSLPYNGGIYSSEYVIVDEETAMSKQIGRIDVLSDAPSAEGVYLPLLYKDSANQLSDSINIQINQHEKTYTICGFFNSVMAGSHNCSMTELIFTQDAYEELQKSGAASPAVLCSIRVADPAKSPDIESSLAQAVENAYPGISLLSNSVETVSKSRYISEMICAGVLCAAAFFVLIVAMAVTASNIGNYIQESMRELGVLLAVGWTGRQLRFALLVQFMLLSLPAAILGAFLSYSFFPAVNDMLIAQSGIPYTVQFLPGPFIATLGACTFGILLSLSVSDRRLGKIETLTALREGFHTHSFRKNRVPLQKTRFPVNLALAWKEAFQNARPNAMIALTMTVLSLLLVFCVLMMQNVVVDSTPVLDLIGIEQADVMLISTESGEDALDRFLAADERVQESYLYTWTSSSGPDGTKLATLVCDDFDDIGNALSWYDGRAPRFENEAGIGAKYARERGYKIGDEVKLGTTRIPYIITGLTQQSNYLGEDIALTREAFSRIGTLEAPAHYINLLPDADINSFITDAAHALGNNLVNSVDVKEVVDTSVKPYTSLMRALVMSIVALGVILAVLVLFLLVRTILSDRKKDFGILKAVGYTTRQLIFQTALSFMPAAVISEATGLFVWSLSMNSIVALFLRGLGIMRCEFTVPGTKIIVCGAALLIFCFLLICLLSLRIRRDNPMELMRED